MRSETGPVPGGTRLRGSPAVGQWITDIQARKLAADARLRAAIGTRPGPERMTKQQIAATVTAISDLMQARRYATTEDKAEVYAGLKAGTRHSYPPIWRRSPSPGIGRSRRADKGDLRPSPRSA